MKESELIILQFEAAVEVVQAIRALRKQYLIPFKKPLTLYVRKLNNKNKPKSYAENELDITKN